MPLRVRALIWLRGPLPLWAAGWVKAVSWLRLGACFDRLGQEADTTGFQGLRGEIFWRRAQHQRRRRLAFAQAGGDLQAIKARQADIEQDHIWFEAVDQRQRFFARGGARFKDCITLEFTDQTAQSLAGLGFVFNDQDIHIALDSCVSLAQG